MIKSRKSAKYRRNRRKMKERENVRGTMCIPLNVYIDKMSYMREKIIEKYSTLQIF